MKIGLLGTGFAVAHAGVYAARPDTEVVVYGRSPGKLAMFAGNFGFATTTDVDAIYADPDVDVVDVCLPTALHKEHILRALAADKHVLCELPIAPTAAEAEEIVRAAEASDKQVFIDMFMRLHPAVRHLHRVIADGSLGALRSLRSYRKAGPIWGPVDLGLDRLALEVMLSDLDYTVAALGQPQEIHAAGVSAGDGRAAVETVLRYDDVVVEYTASSMVPASYGVTHGFEATFTGGVLELHERPFERTGPVMNLTEYTTAGSREITLAPADNYTAAIDHVLDCVTEGTEDALLTPRAATETLRLALDIDRALARS
ncbi:Gfo/Idh/MocA family protein [Streptomyces sp. UNOC14_S4]|uniref:Gfo/Idh/MocA family protein n=1 Tax=Streptomyces sp. UNOC14_S4 TaxID=2872340 RepID=UPI001E500C47|nr:Gfo/Idh/MocA family oxidoreductase [Streptomyces sp. UNOC14_S4]MCC3771283.1 Gfo/Idh/MocA family oxidoreductase [Streptomyces sp. UNOC14_S4]